MSTASEAQAHEAISVGSLYAVTGPYIERTFPVHPVGGLIGRSRKCSVSLLHDCEVSHNHANVEPHAHAHAGFCIRDIGSTFGTYLNDKRLSEPKRASEPYKLKPGDTVKVGQTTLRWQPRQHLDAAASVLRIPPPPLGRDAGDSGASGDAELVKVAASLDRAHLTLCNTAAGVELAVVARRLEQLLRVHAQVDATPIGLGRGDAPTDEWRALLRTECESLRRDVGGLLGQQRECLRKLLGAQSGVWHELRLATAELAGSGEGGLPLRASSVQWLRDANHHARWGYRVIRLAQLWLDALEGTLQTIAVDSSPASPLQQRWKMLDGDARVQLAGLRAHLSAAQVDARGALEARERLAVSEWELLLLARANPTFALADGPAAAAGGGRAAFELGGAALAGVSGPDGLALALPWSLKCYVLRERAAPPGAALADEEQGYFGGEALLDRTACVLQQCRRPGMVEAQLGELHARLVALALRQASGCAGTQHMPPLRAVWREPDGSLWAHLAHAGSEVVAAAGARRGGGARGFGRAEVGGGFASQLSADWRRAFVELTTALCGLHRGGLCAAGVTSQDIALDSEGRVLLLALGLAELGAAERPAAKGGWRWAAIPPEGHDAARAAGGPPVAPPTWAADMWGVGVLLWRAHFGDDLRALHAFLRAPADERPPSVPPPERADSAHAAVLAQLLHREPSMRMPACALLAHPLLHAKVPTSRASSLPDAAAALLSADEDAAHVSAAVAHARASLADVRARARAAADARGAAAPVLLRRASLCADLLAAAGALSELELLGPLAMRLLDEGEEAGEGAGAPLCVEEALSLFWARLATTEEGVHGLLFDAQLAQPLGVRAGSAAGLLADAATAGRAAGASAAAAPAPAAVVRGGHVHPGGLVPRADAPEALCTALGRLLFKCTLDGLPLPLAQLPAYWWRAAVGLGSSSGLPELEALCPLLALQHHALLASGTTDGWMLDFEQLGMAPADVPQRLKLAWLTGRVRQELWTSRQAALTAMHLGFAQMARAGAKEASAELPLQGLPAEALMLLAAGGVTPLAQQLRNALVLRDFPECEKMEAQLFALIDLMSGVQLRRFVLLLTGCVELSPLRPNGTPTVITVRFWPNAADCAPIAHRAALTLDLPVYSSFDKLKQMLCRTLDDMAEAQSMLCAVDS